MATYGKIEEYDETEEWPRHIKRMDHYLEANYDIYLLRRRLGSISGRFGKCGLQARAPAE